MSTLNNMFMTIFIFIILFDQKDLFCFLSLFFFFILLLTVREVFNLFNVPEVV